MAKKNSTESKMVNGAEVITKSTMPIAVAHKVMIGDKAVELFAFDQFTRPGNLFSESRRRNLNCTHIVVDKRAFGYFAEEVMGKVFNSEFVARHLSDINERTEMENALFGGSFGKVLTRCVTGNYVRFGTLCITTPLLLKVVNEVVPDKSSDFVLSFCEIFKGLIAPLGIYDESKQPYCKVTAHVSLYPTFDDIMTDVTMRKLEGAVSEQSGVVGGKAGVTVSVAVLSQRVNDMAWTVGISLRSAIEYRTLVINALRVVKARIDPAFQKEGTGIPLHLIERPEVAALASNLTLAMIALEQSDIEGALTIDESHLRRTLPQIESFIRDSDRYATISLVEFKARFSKSSIRDVKQEPIVSVLTHNMAGGLAVQALNVYENLDGTSTKTAVQNQVVENEMLAYCGNILASIGSSAAHRLAHDTILNAVELGLWKQKGFYDLTGILPHEVKSTLLYLAFAVTDDPILMVNTDGKTNKKAYGFGFPVKLEGINYTPVSANRAFNAAVVLDPREAIHLSNDWKGESFLKNRPQTLPTQALMSHIVQADGLDELIPFSEGKIDVKVSVNSKSYKAFMIPADLFRIGEHPRAALFPPLLNRWMASLTWYAAGDCLSIANAVEGDAFQRNLKGPLFSFMRALPGSVPEQPLLEMKQHYINVVAVSMTPDERMETEARLSMGLWNTQITYAMLEILLRRLGLTETVDTETIFMKLLSDQQFITSV